MLICYLYIVKFKTILAYNYQNIDMNRRRHLNETKFWRAKRTL